jgi:protein-disulfide isomerase
LAVKKKKSNTKSPKKIQVVFEDTNEVLDVKTNKAKKKSTSSKKAMPKKVSSKKVSVTKKVETKKPEHKVEIESVSKKTVLTKKSSKKRDYLIIGVLSALIILILALAFVIPTNSIDKDPIVVVDSNTTIDDNSSKVTMTVEEFEEKSLNLTLNILKDMRVYQHDILKENYEDLNIDSEKMEACLSENNYLLKDSNLYDYEKVSNIQDDFLQAQELSVVSTPTIYVNGYSLSGFKDYNTFTQFIDSQENNSSLDLNYNNSSFSYTDDSVKMYYIYDKENEIVDSKNTQFIEYLRTSEQLLENVNSVFNTLFSLDVEYVQYDSQLGIELLETINSTTLPAMYLLGDSNSVDFNGSDNKEIFNLIFEEETVNNGFVLRKEIFPQLVMGSGLDGIYKFIDYSSIVKESDKVIGEKEAPVSVVLFTDYDCPYCNQFENETLTDEFYENYLDTGKINLVIKPLVTNDVFSIFPILFLKCSQDQDVSLEVHKKLFELNPVIGVKTVYDLVSLKYQDQVDELEEAYSSLAPQMQGN